MPIVDVILATDLELQIERLGGERWLRRGDEVEDRLAAVSSWNGEAASQPG